VSGVKPLDALFLFLAVVAASPYVQLLIVGRRRARALRRLARRRNTRVVALVHRQETIALLGLPVLRYITVETEEEVRRTVGAIPTDTSLDVVVHLPPGVAVDSGRLAALLRRRQGRVTLLTPLTALPPTTALSAAADAVKLGPCAATTGPSASIDVAGSQGRAQLPTVRFPAELAAFLAQCPQPTRDRAWPPTLPLPARMSRPTYGGD
jgi:hypothetical protein